MSAIDVPGQRVRPSAWWYLLVPILLMAAVAFGIAAGIDEGRRIADSFRTLGADGTGSIPLEAGEEPTVWAVWQDGRSSDAISRPPAQVEVTGPRGQDIDFQPGGSETTWSIGSEAGVDLGTFVAPVEGTYTVHVRYEAPGAGGAAAVAGPVPTAAVGTVDVSGSLGRVLRTVGVWALAALALWVVLLALRGRSKRRARRLAAGNPLDSHGGAPTSTPSATSSGPITFE